jgi:Transposase domain (DUF772)
MGFEGAEPEATGRPAYHPGTLLKIYIYGYLNRIQSSRRLERETQRNVGICLRKLSLPSMAASSRRSTAAIGTLPSTQQAFLLDHCRILS